MTDAAQDTPKDIPLDFRGREIKSGSIIVYPVRQGSSMWLREATVTGVESRPGGFALICFDHNATAQRRLIVKNLDRCVVMN